jgi:hypothetical protein
MLSRIDVVTKWVAARHAAFNELHRTSPHRMHVLVFEQAHSMSLVRDFAEFLSLPLNDAEVDAVVREAQANTARHMVREGRACAHRDAVLTPAAGEHARLAVERTLPPSLLSRFGCSPDAAWDTAVTYGPEMELS